MQAIIPKQKAKLKSSDDFKINRIATTLDSEPHEETCFKITGQFYDFKIANSFKETKLSKIFKLNSTILYKFSTELLDLGLQFYYFIP